VILSPATTLVPFLHGSVFFANHVRRLCTQTRFDCIAIDLPAPFAEAVCAAVDDLPYLSLVAARGVDDPLYYVPIDPCDAAIEGVRQSRQSRCACEFVGHPVLAEPEALPPMPDAFAVSRLGVDAYTTLCVHAMENHKPSEATEAHGRHCAAMLRQLEARHTRILALVHLRTLVATVRWYARESSHNATDVKAPTYTTDTAHINPDHAYFALGELPFVVGKFEKERHDPFAPPTDVLDTIKDLFRETRDDYYEDPDSAVTLSPARIQTALKFLRNLTLMDSCFLPSLPDIVEAARGVGGNSYAIRILKSAKYYPFFPVEGAYADVGIDKVKLPGSHSASRAVNLLRDFSLHWRTLSIKPEPSMLKMRKYRYRWNPMGMSSHLPEDRRIENFNAHVRNKTLRAMVEDLVKSEKFSSSVKDGIDCRETLRNWHTGSIYVKEIPPQRGTVDTVVIIFDGEHDDRYPHSATWFAEHPEESTLTFFATDPFAHLIGPGVARAYYGGLSLLFPPRHIPNTFDLTQGLNLSTLAEQLTYGAMMFSRETNVAYVSARRPSVRLKVLGRGLKRHLVWIPISTFSTETLRKLRKFHVLNGKTVRSWATRFIGE